MRQRETYLGNTSSSRIGGRCILFVLFFVLVATFSQLSAQEATLQGRINKMNDDDELQLYVTGSVGTKRIELQDDGTFTTSVDLFEPARCVLYWKGRTLEDNSFVLWLCPDSVSSVELSMHKQKKQSIPEIRFSGACTPLSQYSNLFYQTFERRNLLDSVFLAANPSFAACQSYIESILQPLGESLLDLSLVLPADQMQESAESESQDEEVSAFAQLFDFVDEQRAQLDIRQLDAEFEYALLAERRGQKMDDDAAFQARLAAIDSTDAEHAYPIALMTRWDIVAHPERYAPLTDEAAQLRCLSLFTTSEDVRNEAADQIMQRFFLRVQLGEVNPASPSFLPLYEELKRVSTSDAYDEFIDTQHLIMQHPELFDEGVGDSDEGVDDVPANEEVDDDSLPV